MANATFVPKHLKATMKIAVVGAGVVGIATAYELAMDGHEVSVFDKSAAACEESSFANNGLVAPSLMLPFASPHDQSNALLRFWSTGKGLSQSPWGSLRKSKSLWQWSQANPPSANADRLTAGQQLGRYSTDCLKEMTARSQMEIERSDGQLVLLHTEQALQKMEPRLAELKAGGIASKVLTPEETRKLEPALHSGVPLHAAISFPEDLVSNCRQFALELKSESQKLGVSYHFGHQVQALHLHPRPKLMVQNPAGLDSILVDHVVFCTAREPIDLRPKLPSHLPMMELHGYALSVAIREPLNAPRSAIYDPIAGLVINRLGNRIRVSAGAEIGPKPQAKDTKTVNAMYRALETYFPGAANYLTGSQIWHGTRHGVMDGLPAVGPSSIPHVSFNLGHGACGWTWACGSARLISDMIAARPTAINATPFLPTRFLR